MNTNDILNEFEAAKGRIMADGRLSDQGKAEKVQALKADYTAKGKELKKRLRKTAVMAALQLKDAQAKQSDHLKGAADQLDYQRLNYEAQAIKAKVARAGDLVTVSELWNEAKQAGDPYELKAWETVSLDQFNGPDPTGIKGQLYADFSRVDVREPDPDIRALESEHLASLRAIRNEAQSLDAFFSGGGLMSATNITRQVFDGIEFDREAQVKTGFDYGHNDIYNRQETGEEVAKRLEREASERAEAVAAELEKRGFEIDPDLDL